MLLSMKTHKLWFIVLMLVSVLALAACGGADVEPEEEEVEEEEGEPEEVDEEEEEDSLPTISGDVLLDPANASDADSEVLNELLYDTLTVATADGLEAGLAASWFPSDDELDWIFELRSNAVFHDGTPIDADAVVENFNRWFDPSDPLHGTGNYLAWEEAFGGFLGEDDSDGVALSTFDGIEKADTVTIVMHLTRPEPDLPLILADTAFSIVNPAAIEADVNSYGTQDSEIVGSGAYELESWGDAELELSTFDAYYGDAPDAAQVYAIE